MTLRVNATIHQGEDAKLTFYIWTSADKTQAKSLPGATATYRVGNKSRGTVVLEKAGTISGASNEKVVVQLTGVETAGLLAKKWNHQLEIVDSGGLVNVVTDGILNVEERLTP